MDKVAKSVSSGALEAPELPTLIFDETLFSWASRYHRDTANALATHTSQQLFGAPRAGSQHDLTCALDALVLRTRGRLGTAEELARQRTLLPFYLPTREPLAQAAAISTLRSDRLGSLKYQLGMLTGGFGAHHPLKACRECLREDSARYGDEFWHRSQQWPGVWVCCHHETWLAAGRVKVHGIQRFQWILPHGAEFGPLPRARPPRALFALAEVVAGWTALPAGFAFDPARLLAAYRQAVNERSWVKGDSLDLSKIATEYHRWSAPLRHVPELLPLVGSDDVASPVARLLRRPRGGIHPLRHLATIAWLFSDWTEFCAVYSRACHDSPRPSKATTADLAKAKQRQEQRATLVTLLRVEKTTVRQAARRVGVAIATAQRWATDAGDVVARRPKLLHDALRRKIIARLRRGETQSGIAKALDVHVGLVRAVLRTEVGLRAQWRAAGTRVGRSRARGRWLSLRKRFRSASRKALRQKAAAAYAWLYRNDREWLFAHSPAVVRKRRLDMPRRDWQARDIVLSDAVEKLGKTLRKRAVLQSIPLWRLCQGVPGLRPALHYLPRLPRTRLALWQLRGVPAGKRSESVRAGTHVAGKTYASRTRSPNRTA